MQRFWLFLGDKGNREILGWAGGGIAFAAAGLWAVFVYLFPTPSSGSKAPAPQAPQATQSTQANCGGIAIGGNVAQSTVTAGNTTGADCSTRPK